MKVAGKNVVVTGIIPGHSRTTAEEALRDAGAYVSGGVNGKTDLLITGAKVGAAKTKKAKELGVTVVPWEQIAFGDELPVVDLDATAENANWIRHTRTRQIAPMLAVKGDGSLPTGDEWSYEIKWDGVRCVATVSNGAVAMNSRSSKTDYTGQYPHIAAELATLPDCVIDGELVVLTQQGGSFQDLAKGNGRGSYVVFDVIESVGDDLRALPLSERRVLLDAVLVASKKKLKYIATGPVESDGEALHAFCVKNKMEGIVAKRNDSRYKDGARDKDWVKVKVRLSQEFVVVGYTVGEGKREDVFGALLLAAHEDGKLVYCGRVGTGWDDDELDRLHGILGKLATTHQIPMFDNKMIRRTKASAETVTWVKPKIVVQIEFQRWTDDERLWHPSYQGQRKDKLAIDVTKEA